jgi:hypothetical protein
VRRRELVVVAPSFVGVGDACCGPGRRSLEVFMSSCRCGVSDVVDRVVVVELALGFARHESENADVPVGQDRAPGAGNVIDTPVAQGGAPLVRRDGSRRCAPAWQSIGASHRIRGKQWCTPPRRE